MIDRSFEIVIEPLLTSNISKQEMVEYINQTKIPVAELKTTHDTRKQSKDA